MKSLGSVKRNVLREIVIKLNLDVPLQNGML